LASALRVRLTPGAPIFLEKIKMSDGKNKEFKAVLIDDLKNKYEVAFTSKNMFHATSYIMRWINYSVYIRGIIRPIINLSIEEV
jgi:hypothetical protein